MLATSCLRTHPEKSVGFEVLTCMDFSLLPLDKVFALLLRILAHLTAQIFAQVPCFRSVSGVHDQARAVTGKDRSEYGASPISRGPRLALFSDHG